MNPSLSLPDTFESEAEHLAFQALMARGLPIPLSPAARATFQEQFNRIPAMTFMGCELDLRHDSIVRTHLPEVQVHHQGGMGTEAVNGAMIAGLCDCALGVSGVLQFDGKRAGTVEMSIKFMRPTIGRSVTAYAAALKRGGNVVFSEVELYCEGVLCALATGMVSTPSEGSDEAFS